MYIWRVKNLSEEFRAGTVTDRQQLPYLLVFVGLSCLASDSYINGWLACDALNSFDLLMLPLALITGLGGTLLCYRAALPNKNGFLARYICLGIPIFVRIIVLVILLIFSSFVVNDYLLTIPAIDQYLKAEETSIVDLIVFCMIEAVYFWWLYSAIRSSYNNA